MPFQAIAGIVLAILFLFIALSTITWEGIKRLGDWIGLRILFFWCWIIETIFGNIPESEPWKDD